MMEKNHICKKCGGIAGWDSYFQSWICTRCGNEEPKPITNADRIRAMTDEELAEWLGLKVSACNGNEKCGDNYTCDACWLNWLKQEIRE